MPAIVETSDRRHAVKSWSKEMALLNIHDALMTAETLHALMSWLKEEAP